MTEVQSSTMSRESAERLTERIRMVATTFMETRDKLSTLIREAQEGRAHEALGFRSWTEYIAAVCSETPLMRLTRDERKVIVSDLAEQGMSSRAIAPVVGASVATVKRDVAAPGSNEPPAEEPVVPTVDTETGEVQPRSITGMDGKTYTRPEPKEAQPVPRKRPRRPIHETARRAAMNLRDATDRLGVEFDDDRFPSNAEELAPLLRNQLTYVIESCQGYLDAITPNKE